MPLPGEFVRATDLSTIDGDVTIEGNLTVEGIGATFYAVKTASSSYTSTTSLVADTELVVPVGANEVWFIEFYLMMTGTDGDIRTDWSVPSGATGLRTVWGPSAALELQDSSDTNMRVGVHTFTTATGYGLNSAASFTGAREWGLVTTTGTAGDVAIRHAQESSTANASQMRAGSFVLARRVA